MQAISEIRKLAKAHNFKITTKTNSFGRCSTLVNGDTGNSVGDVFFGECPVLKRIQAFKASVSPELEARFKEEEGSLVWRGIFG